MIVRVGLKLLVFSLDKKSHAFVGSLLKPQANSYFLRGDEQVLDEATYFRSPQFHLISMLKVLHCMHY